MSSKQKKNDALLSIKAFYGFEKKFIKKIFIFHFRFMRGELNIRNEYRNALNRAGLDITAPSTPGTASSMRTNPPSYQRMHSNDSNKGNDSKDGASNGRISD